MQERAYPAIFLTGKSDRGINPLLRPYAIQCNANSHLYQQVIGVE